MLVAIFNGYILNLLLVAIEYLYPPVLKCLDDLMSQPKPVKAADDLKKRKYC